MDFQNFEKYKWFFTGSDKLVVGGKSAEQNEKLVKKIIRTGKNYVVMHTSQPGSPFCIIVSDIRYLKARDLEEAAIFTASFSRQWRAGKKTTDIDVFTTRQIFKEKKMKKGTFGVKGKIEKRKVKMELVLCFQKDILRAVPFSATKEKFLVIKPGKLKKEEAATKILARLKKKKLGITKEKIMQAIPSGNISLGK